MPVRADSFGMTLILAGMTSMTALALDTYVPALPQMSQDLGVSSATGQLTLTVFLIGNAAGAPVGIARGAYEAFLGRLPGRRITYTDYPSQAEAPVTHMQIARRRCAWPAPTTTCATPRA